MKIDQTKLAKLAEITVEAMPEDIPVRGHASAWGETEDRQCAHCDGTGQDLAPIAIDEEREECKECGGRGMITVDLDEELAQKLEERLERDDVWAWCQVEVTATYAGVTGVAYLGACSYEDKRDFIDSGGYYEDMVREAIADLASAIERGEAERDQSLRAVLADPPRDACACCPEFPLFNESEPT